MTNFQQQQSEAAENLRKLLDQTKPFTEENKFLSWFYFLSTLLFVILATVLTAQAVNNLNFWPLNLALSVLTGLIIIRLFVIYHDYAHGSILKDSTTAQVLMGFVGGFFLRPPYEWRRSHNFHHANNCKFETAATGSFPIKTVTQYSNLSKKEKLSYHIVRNPLVLIFGYLTCFLMECVKKMFFKDRMIFLQSAFSLVFHLGYLYTVHYFFGFNAFIWAAIIPFTVACFMGALLFYVQHNFEEAHFLHDEEWNYLHSAMASSSFMKCGPMMNWFSANIGYHHIHHLNPKIPFYNLPKAMAAIDALQKPRTFYFNIKSVIRAMNLKLWDEQQQKMIPYPAK